jgi:hypothetical protein
MSKSEQQMAPPPQVTDADTPKFSDEKNSPVNRKSLAQERSEASRAGTAKEVEPEPVESFPIWTDPENAPTERASVADDPTGESNTDLGGEGGEGEVVDGALGWDVTVSGGPYTLSVDGVATTELSEASTLAEIETALNETSGPVGLDVSGDPASVFSVSTDTPAELTASGAATVEVTQVPE